MADHTDAARAEPGDKPKAGLTRAEYFAERGLLIEARQRGYQRADQMVVGGATGALVLSITFLEKIAPAATVVETGFLIGAWVALLACLAASLVGHYASARAFDHELACLNASVHGRPTPANRWARANDILGRVGAFLLIAGIVLLARFAYVNAPFSRGGGG